MTSVLTYVFRKNNNFGELQDPETFAESETVFLNRIIYEVDTKSISTDFQNTTFMVGTTTIRLENNSYPTLSEFISELNTNLKGSIPTDSPQIIKRFGNYYFQYNPFTNIVFPNKQTAALFGVEDLTLTGSETLIKPNPRLSSVLTLNTSSNTNFILPTVGNGELANMVVSPPIVLRLPKSISINNAMYANGDDYFDAVKFTTMKKIYLEFSTN